MLQFTRDHQVNRLVRQTREIAFIKDGIVADQQLLGAQIVELPGLVLWGVSNEDALLRMRLQTLPLITLDVYIGKTAKNTKMGHIRLVPMPELKRSRVLLNCSSR